VGSDEAAIATAAGATCDITHQHTCHHGKEEVQQGKFSTHPLDNRQISLIGGSEPVNAKTLWRNACEIDLEASAYVWGGTTHGFYCFIFYIVKILHMSMHVFPLSD
jgi:hypothetical protein